MIKWKNLSTSTCFRTQRYCDGKVQWRLFVVLTCKSLSYVCLGGKTKGSLRPRTKAQHSPTARGGRRPSSGQCAGLVFRPVNGECDEMSWAARMPQ